MGSTDTTRTHIPMGDQGKPSSDGFSIPPQDSGWDVPPVPLSSGFRAKLPTVPMLTPARVGLSVAIVLLLAVIVVLARGGRRDADVPKEEPGKPVGPLPGIGGAAEQDGLTVRLMSVKLRKDRQHRPALYVLYSIRNTTADRRWYYKPAHWSPRLVDQLGNVLNERPNAYPEVRVYDMDTPLEPRKSVFDTSVFEPPVKSSKTLTLTIPGALFCGTPGGYGRRFADAVFTIPFAHVVNELD